MSDYAKQRLDKWFNEYLEKHGHNPTYEEVFEMKDIILFDETFKNILDK